MKDENPRYDSISLRGIERWKQTSVLTRQVSSGHERINEKRVTQTVKNHLVSYLHTFFFYLPIEVLVNI